MDILDYYNEKKWCEKCGAYVRFLMSVDQSWCVECGSPVRLFSKSDLQAFQAGLQAEKENGKNKRRPKAS